MGSSEYSKRGNVLQGHCLRQSWWAVAYGRLRRSCIWPPFSKATFGSAHDSQHRVRDAMFGHDCHNNVDECHQFRAFRPCNDLPPIFRMSSSDETLPRTNTLGGVVCCVPTGTRQPHRLASKGPSPKAHTMCMLEEFFLRSNVDMAGTEQLREWQVKSIFMPSILFLESWITGDTPHQNQDIKLSNAAQPRSANERM